MIYFTQDSGSLNIKIGFTEKEDLPAAEARAKNLQTGNPSKLVVLAVMPGTKQDEKTLHEKFDKHCVGGEWFRPIPDVLKLVAKAKADAAVAAKKAPLTLAGSPGPTINVYLAGKISKGDWRSSIVDVIHPVQEITSCPIGSIAPSRLDDGVLYSDEVAWPILRSVIFGKHNYVGPYFMACDHGCYHGDDQHGVFAAGRQQEVYNCGGGHGCGKESCDGDCSVVYDQSRAPLVNSLCLNSIKNCDLLFAWIDTSDCYGTIIEIGYAAAKNKRVVIAGPKQFRDMWFVYKTASSGFIQSNSPSEALYSHIAEFLYDPLNS